MGKARTRKAKSALPIRRVDQDTAPAGRRVSRSVARTIADVAADLQLATSVVGARWHAPEAAADEFDAEFMRYPYASEMGERLAAQFDLAVPVRLREWADAVNKAGDYFAERDPAAAQRYAAHRWAAEQASGHEILSTWFPCGKISTDGVRQLAKEIGRTLRNVEQMPTGEVARLLAPKNGKVGRPPKYDKHLEYYDFLIKSGKAKGPKDAKPLINKQFPNSPLRGAPQLSKLLHQRSKRRKTGGK